jgi:hypothetical protein
MKQMRIWAMKTSGEAATIPQTKKAGNNVPALSDPLHYSSLEDPHDDCPQEYEDETNSENVQLSRHGNPPCKPEA